MDIGAVVLHMVLEQQSLEAWARVRAVYFDTAYSGIFAAINRFYNKHNSIPSFDDLNVFCARDAGTVSALNSLRTIEVPDVDIDIAIEALVDQFAQNKVVLDLDKFTDKLPTLDVEEIKEALAVMVLDLDEATVATDKVYNPADCCIFEDDATSQEQKVPLGFNNTFDSVLGGGYLQDLILIGGKRGAGKSVICANIITSQFEQGNPSVYFSIEMPGQQIFQRMCSILSNVDHQHIRQNNLSDSEVLALVKARASMFVDSSAVVDAFMEHRDRLRFERELRKLSVQPHAFTIIDDRELSITAIDLHLQKLKAKYKDKLKVAVVDYLNQIVFPGSKDGMYDWKVQIEVSKQLKNLARKYDLVIVSPMQIDDNNGVRFAKGILDAPDSAYILDAFEKEDNTIGLTATKTRSGPPIEVFSGISWSTLRINPVDVVKPEKRKAIKEETHQAKAATSTSRGIDDAPW